MTDARDKVTVGMTIPPFDVNSVSAEKMKTVALFLSDPNPIHWDVDAVRALGMGERVINQGPNNMGYIVNALIDWAGDPGAIRRLTVRFLGNVFAGDALRAGGVVTDLRQEDGGPVADLDVWLDRGEGDRVMAGTATVVLG